MTTNCILIAGELDGICTKLLCLNAQGDSLRTRSVRIGYRRTSASRLIPKEKRFTNVEVVQGDVRGVNADGATGIVSTSGFRIKAKGKSYG
jgi:hypothetical protein